MSSAPSPEELVAWTAEARNGDRDALKKLFEVYKDRVYRTAMLLLSSRDAAEAVTEEVFVSYAREASPEGTEFEPWAFRAAVQLCVRHMSTNEDGDAPLERLSVHAADRGTAIRRRIARALNVLPPRARVAFVLREGQGCTYDEIAGVMDEDPGRVAHHLAAARAGLAGVLEEIEFDALNAG